MKPTNFRTPERWNSVPVPARVAERAITNMTVADNGCWISNYSTGSHGYAQVGWSVPREERTGRSKNRMVLAHRAAWVHRHGQMPLGMTIDHLCKERRCVNPDHMRMLPNYENARRTHGRDWPLGFCAHGHDSSKLIQKRTNANASGMATVCGVCEKERRQGILPRKRDAA